jgi:hypothetical protein
MESKVVLISPEELSSMIREAVRQELQTTRLENGGEKLISPAEACKLFSPAVSKPTLKKWTDDGLLNMHRIGGRTYYKHSEVLASTITIKKFTPGRK